MIKRLFENTILNPIECHPELDSGSNKHKEKTFSCFHLKLSLKAGQILNQVQNDISKFYSHLKTKNGELYHD